MHHLDPIHLAIASGIAEGLTFTAIARASGLHRSTIYNWLRSNPVFAKTVNNARIERTAHTIDTITELQIHSLIRLKEIICSPDTKPSDALKAIKLVLVNTANQSLSLPVHILPPEEQKQLEETAALAPPELPCDTFPPLDTFQNPETAVEDQDNDIDLPDTLDTKTEISLAPPDLPCDTFPPLDTFQNTETAVEDQDNDIDLPDTFDTKTRSAECHVDQPETNHYLG